MPFHPLITGDSNPEHAAKLMHWALVQGIVARLAEQSAQDVQQGGQAHSLIERMAVDVPPLSSRETDDDVGTEDVGMSDVWMDDATTGAAETSLPSEAATSDPELGIANGKGLETQPSSMELAKSTRKASWRGESRVRTSPVGWLGARRGFGSKTWGWEQDMGGMY